ncbi:flavin reductase [Peptoniphilus sp. ING2-D1G]|nr:flavin reductase [Peptoniphilus sp. ING2-D1G]
MNILILKGSPRKKGNTNSIVEIFKSEMEKSENKVVDIHLYDMNLKGCVACKECQQFNDKFGCPIKDDMQKIFDLTLKADLIILATPIYSWYCTAPMKAVLDRLVYGMNKYYGQYKNLSLWQGKNLAIITTFGYGINKGPDLFEEGIKRYCKHSKLNYRGMLGQRHLGYNTKFMDDDKIDKTIEFAKILMDKTTSNDN